MHLIQMRIAFSARAKRGHAHPTNMSPASTASHMVAALNLLHGRLALRAVLDSQLLFDLLQRLVPARCEVFVLSACHSGVRTVTGGTGWDQAFGAGEDGG